MDPNTSIFGDSVLRQYDTLQSYQSGNSMQEDLLSYAMSKSPDALHMHRECPDHWNNIDTTPSPPAFQGPNYVHPPSLGLYSDEHGYGETQYFDVHTQQFGHIKSHEQHTYPNHNENSDYSVMLGLHHPPNFNQYPPVHHQNVIGERTPDHHVAFSGENTAQSKLGWRLRPVSDLPDRFRGAFKFRMFNVIQSTCFDQVLHSEDNLVISAPTGSGKTVLFELGIIQMLTRTSNDARSAKCVYVAPTKALCTEKHKEWTAKFGGLGVKCCELTGDTLLLGRGVWGDAKDSHIIVTTAEKWDNLTRNWTDHSRILSQVKLFLVDEIHVLGESRGSTLEVIVSRMKVRGSGIRFLLISATVPNIEDVAYWIGNGDSGQPAKTFQFGEEFRPCKLTKFVYGVAKPKGQNDFAYARTLDSRLFHVLQQHSANKPILVFCPTRKGTLDTAKQLAKDYEQATKKKQKLPWLLPARTNQKFHDKDLVVLASAGIAVHHAGLNTDDRRMVEELYLRKALCVLVSTSTLAVGVNLPAQMVVIKGVKLYQNGEMREYSDLDIMQMMGRAGRPQFDDEGTAVILCEPELEHKYRTLVQGSTALESTLHQNLAEHINSEIGLGTISTIENAKEWLRHSFLFRRVQKNPHHYDIGKYENETWTEKIDGIVMQSILSLRDIQLIAYDERDGGLSSTDYGDVMSKFYIRQATMRTILTLTPSATKREILELVSVSEEVSDLKLRSGEKQMYEKIRCHSDIRFPPKKIVNTSDKILLLIQAILAGLSLSSPEFKPTEGQPFLEAASVFRHATRIVTAVAEVAIIDKNGTQLKHSLELVRCFNAKAWEDRPLVLRQIEHIGEKSVKVLAENGINSIQKLLHTSPLQIEELLNRRPPFGLEVLAAANEFPRYYLDIKELKSVHSNGKSPVEVEFVVQCGLAISDSTPQRTKRYQRGKTEMTTLLIVTSDMVFIDFRRVATKALYEKKEFTFTAQLTKPSQSINAHIASEKFAGVTITRTVAPSVPPDKYPTLETRPLTSIEMDLQGLEDIPDFWNIDLDNDDDVMNSQVLDSAKCRDEKAPKAQPSLFGPLVEQQTELGPKKRQDGKYECNHACKDKLKCRHHCCQEGLSDPPRASKKKKQATVHDSGSGPSPPRQNATAARSLQNGQREETGIHQSIAESRTKAAKRNSVSQLSKKMHEKANTTRKSLIEQGSELANDSRTSQNHKVAPNFDLQFSTLKHSRSLTSIGSVSTDDSGHCDELPLISEVWKQDNTMWEVGSVKTEGCKAPRSKRSRIDPADGLSESGPLLSHKRVYCINPPSSTRPLFLPGSDDEGTMNSRDGRSPTKGPSIHSVEDSSGGAPDTVARRASANDLNTCQPARVSSGWSRDDASSHQTSLCSNASRAAPPAGGGGRNSTQSTLGRNNCYALPPSRITGFIRRSQPYIQDHSTTSDSTVGSFSLTSRKRFPDSSVDSQATVDPNDSKDIRDVQMDDPLAEFDRWLASGAVVVIPDPD